MWPWEHLALGYLLFSTLSHAGWRDAPTTRAAMVVAVASQLPDIVDKPLGWWLALTPGGRSVAHSLLTAVPLVVAVAVVGWYLNANRSAAAFAIGYLSHLAGDVLYPLVVRGELRIQFLLWPVTTAGGDPVESPFAHIGELVGAFILFLDTPFGVLYLLADALLLLTALTVWWTDGAPGLGLVRREIGDGHSGSQ